MTATTEALDDSPYNEASVVLRPALLQALEEIGDLDITFGGTPGADGGATSHEAGEATEIPEVDSPLDD